ncbi:30350_t:CDS:1, partial [Racocetra persica]
RPNEPLNLFPALLIVPWKFRITNYNHLEFFDAIDYSDKLEFIKALMLRDHEIIHLLSSLALNIKNL